MLQPNEPVILALRQDIVELKRLIKELEEHLQAMNVSVQDAFQGMASGTGMTVKFLDARIDDIEERLVKVEPGVIGSIKE